MNRHPVTCFKQNPGQCRNERIVGIRDLLYACVDSVDMLELLEKGLPNRLIQFVRQKIVHESLKRNA